MTKTDMDSLLRALGKELHKLHKGKNSCEIILVGGAAVVLSYNFRDSSGDIDALYQENAQIAECVDRVAEKLGFPTWMNDDFKLTSSYSTHLREYSEHYRTYGNGALEIRIIRGAFLIAMKLIAARSYKNDLSDVVGILQECADSGIPITKQQILDAVTKLYGPECRIPPNGQNLLDKLYGEGGETIRYETVRSIEQSSRKNAITFEKEYPGIMKQDNASDILAIIAANEKHL